MRGWRNRGMGRGLPRVPAGLKGAVNGAAMAFALHRLDWFFSRGESMAMLRQIAVFSVLGVAGLMIGCAERPMTVPVSAQLMTEGQSSIVFRPVEFGRVYVSNQATGEILYQADVERGDVVEVDARMDRVTVGGRVVTERPLDEGHNYRIFFEPMSKERVVKYRVTETEVRRDVDRR